MGAKLKAALLISVIAAVSLVTVPATSADEKKLTYKRGAEIALPYGGKIDDAVVLDVFDIDGDGADDLAVAGKVESAAHAPVHSFIIRNNTDTGKPQVFDLGEDGLTRRTWAGKFYRETDGQVYFVLGRGGEVGGFDTNFGESVSIFKVTPTGNNFATETMFVSEQTQLTTSVDRCDIDNDAVGEIYINNYNTPDADPTEEVSGAPSMIRMTANGFEETDVRKWLKSMDRHGANNKIEFHDIDGDGDCDLLSAMEVAKHGTKTLTYPETESYAYLNDGGQFIVKPLVTPNPHFAPDSSAFTFTMLNEGGNRLFFVHSSFYGGPDGDDIHDAYLQAYRYVDGAFVEVTDEVIDKQLPLWSVNSSYVRFNDIDKDGDQDLYFAMYSGDIHIYRNLGGQKFRLEKVMNEPDGGTKAIAFLTNPTTACSDVVAVLRNGKMLRFLCR
jgi:hypothetical protein